MPTLADRIDVSSVTTTFLTLPKGKKRGSGIGFCGGDPIANVEGSGAMPPFRWVDGKPRAVSFQDIKKFSANGASDAQLTGYWTTPKGDERALVWTRTADDLQGIELHPPAWQKSVALACGDNQQIGYGYENFVRDPSRALLWSGTRDSMVALTGPDPSRDSMGHDVAGGIQVGYVGGGPGRSHACLWRGSSESHVDLHPPSPDFMGSEAWGVGDGQQVGIVWTENTVARAALWTGSGDSYINLSPDGFVRSRAVRCASGLQVGWVSREGRSMMLRAILWNGAAEDYLDLQNFLSGPWNASWAQDLFVDGDRLLILGSAQQSVKQSGYEMDAGKMPVMWELKLRIPEPRRISVLPAINVSSQTSVARPSDEQKVQRVAADFAQAVIDRDFKSAHACLAPWLRKQVTARKLQGILKKELIDGVEPADFATSGNDSSLDELRDHYHDYHQDDRGRTLAATEDFGVGGPPSIYLADEITPENFRQWMSIDFTPDPDGDSDLDFCLRLWLIVVEVNGTMVIGHLEPGE